MRHHYPENSEHEYLWSLIQDRYFAEDAAEVAPLYEAGWQALTERNLDRRRDIDRLINRKRWDLCHRRWRREEILNWLWMDSELRREGKTYPDVYETPRDKVCSADEF